MKILMQKVKKKKKNRSQETFRQNKKWQETTEMSLELTTTLCIMVDLKPSI